MAWVMRVRAWHDNKPCVSYLTKQGWCSSNPRDAEHFNSIAEAWDKAIWHEMVGEDEEGPWCWTEEIGVDIPS